MELKAQSCRSAGVLIKIPIWSFPDALAPLKLIPLTVQANGVGLEITKRPLLPEHATVVLDRPAPRKETSVLTLTVEDHEKLPAGIRTVFPADAALMAAWTSEALPLADIVPFPFLVKASAETLQKNQRRTAPAIGVIITNGMRLTVLGGKTTAPRTTSPVALLVCDTVIVVAAAVSLFICLRV